MFGKVLLGGLVALVTVLPAVSAEARHGHRGRTFGGHFGRGHNHFNFRLGFGSHRHRGHTVLWGYPGFSFGYPFYGYSPFYQPFYTSPFSFWNVGLPYGYLGYPRYVEPHRPAPAVIDASRVIVNQPQLVPCPERPADERERFYLDRAPALRPVSLVDLAREQIRVELAEPGMYFVRWTGPTEGLMLVEFQSVDGAGQVLASRLIKEAPFRGLLRVPEKTAAVLISVEQKSGAGASVKLPLAEFKALEAK